jgi:hypothetical protein
MARYSKDEPCIDETEYDASSSMVAELNRGIIS